MPKLVRLALVVPTLAIMAVASATVALADNGVNVSIDPTATLTAKVEVAVTVTASCPSGWSTMFNSVSIEQAVGKSIARGTAYMAGIQCTGADQVIPVTILADPLGPPFKKGTAIVSASLSAFSYGGTFTGGSATANSEVKIR
ncbi:MAG: hypothetical protein QOH92_761 [Chloroflexota bacterium]|jgi:hypothetical protein|nr:hypothetical protein [Chloroflexota bacterium]